jgi:hypothetical protein
MLFLFGGNTKSRMTQLSQMSRTSSHVRHDYQVRVDIVLPFNDFKKLCKMKTEEPRTSENRRMRSTLVFPLLQSAVRLGGMGPSLFVHTLTESRV